MCQIIINQENNFNNYREEVKECIKMVKAQKKSRLDEEVKQIFEIVDPKLKRTLELAQEVGAGLWLSARPVKSYGYTLNKQEFKDSVCLRYGWNIPNTPSFCQCNQRNSIDHTLSCKKGGYVSMRHNKVRDLEAELMREVGKNVQIEPELLRIENDHTILLPSTNTKDKARLDVSGVGVWGAHEKTFLDIRIMHPICPSYINKPIKKVYEAHEKEKKREYNERILHVEKGSFVPIVGSTFGGMAG